MPEKRVPARKETAVVLKTGLLQAPGRCFCTWKNQEDRE